MATNGIETSSVAAAAIVVVGGRSRRMGTDKASLVVDGVSMLDRVLDALAQAGITNTVVAGSRELPDPAAPDGVDEPQGPLAGVVSGWAYLQAKDLAVDPVVVLSCDLPSLSAPVVRDLVTASRDHLHGAVAHDGDRPQPLIAAYRPPALDHMTTVFATGERSLRRCFAGWDLATVHFDANVLRDADEPSDLSGFDVQWPSS